MICETKCILDNSKISPRELSVHLGESVTFYCLSDNPEEEYSWYFNYQSTETLVRQGKFLNIRRYRKSLHVDNVTEINQGYYSCRSYTNEKHPVTEEFIEFHARATLTVKGMLMINNLVFYHYFSVHNY